jgi:DNA primase
MSRIKTESVEAVKDTVDMLDLVSGYTQLRGGGSNYSGRCPFHDERTPSFSVNPLKKVYFCFGCQAKGDEITFVMEKEGLDFNGAIEWLADRYNVRLEYEESSPQEDRRRTERDRLLRLLDETATFYARYLWEAEEAEQARAYLHERGITRDTAQTFRVGYAPVKGNRLVRAAQGKGFSSQEIARAGLSAATGRGDRFRGRTVFPLADARGRVRGFGARQMPGGRPPKYLNSQDGPLFRKSEIVYGLDLARAEVARQSAAIVVEGYTDVLLLHQVGIANAVASMGTALTDQQVKELRKSCSTVFLAFDADAAGEEASIRGMELAQSAGLVVRVVTLPEGRDPADVALDDPDEMRRALESAETYLAYRVRRALESGGTRDERYQRVRAVLAAAPASIERAEQVQLVSDRLTLTPDLAAALVSREATVVMSADGGRVRQSPRDRDEALFLALCLEFPDVGSNLLGALDMAHFQSASRWEAAMYVRRALADETLPEEAHTWAPQMAEWTALLAREGGSEAVLQELYSKLLLHRTEDELKALRQNADLSLSQQQHLQDLQELRLTILETIRSSASQE